MSTTLAEELERAAALINSSSAGQHPLAERLRARAARVREELARAEAERHPSKARPVQTIQGVVFAVPAEPLKTLLRLTGPDLPASTAKAAPPLARTPAICTHPSADVDGICHTCGQKVATAVPVEFARRVAELRALAAPAAPGTPVCKAGCGTVVDDAGSRWCSAACQKAGRPLNPSTSLATQGP